MVTIGGPMHRMVNYKPAIRIMAKWYPQLIYDPCTQPTNIQTVEDLKVYLRTWIGVRSDDGRSIITNVVSNTRHSSGRNGWVHLIEAYVTTSPRKFEVVGTISTEYTEKGLESIIVASRPSEFARPHARRLNREIIHQRLEAVIRATVSPQSILMRIQRHRLYDRNVFNSVTAIYLKV
jgi:hypothetical protein